MQPDNFYAPECDITKRLNQQDIYTSRLAGFSATDDDYNERGIDLNKELIRNKPATFFMRVNSDALEYSGIYKGDVVIVDRSLKASNGKVIIATLNGEMLIRRFEKINSQTRLLADSNKLAPISIEANCEDFGIWGVVTYVIHKP